MTDSSNNVSLDQGIDFEVPASLALAALYELPDLHQHLFIQTTLTTFYPFSKLPIEIRLKIWKIAMRRKPRTICLSPAGYFSSLNKSIAPPVTHRICQESRAESQKHYKVMYVDFPSHPRAIRVCVNPDVDLIECNVVRLSVAFDWNRAVWDPKNKEFYGSIKRLAINCVWWSQSEKERFMATTWRTLKHFRGLKELHLRNCDLRWESDKEVTKHPWVKFYRGIYEEEKKQNPTLSVPAITFRGPETTQDSWNFHNSCVSGKSYEKIMYSGWF